MEKNTRLFTRQNAVTILDNSEKDRVVGGFMQAHETIGYTYVCAAQDANGRCTNWVISDQAG